MRAAQQPLEPGRAKAKPCFAFARRLSETLGFCLEGMKWPGFVQLFFVAKGVKTVLFDHMGYAPSAIMSGTAKESTTVIMRGLSAIPAPGNRVGVRAVASRSLRH